MFPIIAFLFEAKQLIGRLNSTDLSHISDNCTDARRLEKSRAQRILWLLEELKVDYELKTYKRQNMFAPSELKEVHPLGKSPLISVETEATSKPLVLAESGLITEYLAENFGPWLVPKKYQEGKDGQAGGETEGWLRYRYYMHYAEGSLMPMLLIALLMNSKPGHMCSTPNANRKQTSRRARLSSSGRWPP